MPRQRNRGSSPAHAVSARAPARAAASRGGRSGRPFRVLVVDSDAATATHLGQCTPSDRQIKVLHARTLAEAHARLDRQPIDLAVIEPNLPDGSGFQLARTLRSRRRRTQTLFVTHQPSVDTAIEALRLGASDLLLKPLDPGQLARRVRELVARHDHDWHQVDRIRRLRRACHKLNNAREEISRQVDVLCNDLVTAYQELAEQMQQTLSSSEYQAAVRDELNLESLLRKTLEYLVERAGPTNAALFLPANGDEFSLGGYVNFDCSSAASDLLLQHLGDVFAPRVARQSEVIHLNSDEARQACLGDDVAYLAECDVLAFACRHEDEPLAVIALFRDRRDPFSDELAGVCASVGPIMAEALSKLIRVHHRMNFFDEPDRAF